MSDISSQLAELRIDGLYRELREVESPQGPRVRIDGREVLLLCSNDYLGLAADPQLRAAAADAAERWGAGAGASRLVSGNMTLHRQLEEDLASFKNYPRSVLFGSGFLANLGTIAALAGPGDVVLSDAYNHASIIDGCRLARAETIIYQHGDLDSLESGLRRTGGRPALIVTDAVFSMDGDLAPLKGIVELARHHRARVMVDEAHATGVVGPGGRGLVAELGLEDGVDVVIGTLGKALGSYGAFACCSVELADYLVNRVRTLIYSTALPPPVVAAARAAVGLLRSSDSLVRRLWANARLIRDGLSGHGVDVASSEMPIVPIVLGDPRLAMAVSERALAAGLFVQAIRPPTVPQGTSRLRVVATAAHDPAELREAAAILAAAVQAEPRETVSRAPRGTN